MSEIVEHVAEPVRESPLHELAADGLAWELAKSVLMAQSNFILHPVSDVKIALRAGKNQNFRRIRHSAASDKPRKFSPSPQILFSRHFKNEIETLAKYFMGPVASVFKGRKVYIIPENDVSRTFEKVIKMLPALVEARRGELDEEAITALIKMMRPEDEGLADVQRQINFDNAKLRVEFMEKIPCIRSHDIAKAAGHSIRNAAATASRWKKEGKIFSVTYNGFDWYPAFQFRDGVPHPAVAQALAALSPALSPWNLAFWWAAGNGWLEGATPMDKLDDRAALIAAAGRTRETFVD